MVHKSSNLLRESNRIIKLATLRIIKLATLLLSYGGQIGLKLVHSKSVLMDKYVLMDKCLISARTVWENLVLAFMPLDIFRNTVSFLLIVLLYPAFML